MSYKIGKLSNLLKGKSNGVKIPSDVDLGIIEGLLELARLVASKDADLAAKLNLDAGVTDKDYNADQAADAERQVDNVDFKVDNDPQ
jgi:hypothetical protein